MGDFATGRDVSTDDDSPSIVADAGALPRAFGKYVLFDRIGRGGMARIYLAMQQLGLDGERLTVVKQVLPELSGDAVFSKMFVAEAKLAAQLRHTNVVQVYELGREDGQLYLAMEYVEGFDLSVLLRELSRARVPLPADFALFIVRETLQALDYAHRARGDRGQRLGIVHRDVSPSNVLLSFEGEVKLCDFGIARALAAHESMDPGALQQKRVAGKAAYMSPEHARGLEIDARSDVFAAGILLWELCAGRRLYRGTEDQMLSQAMAGAVPPLPDRGLPKQALLQDVLDRALAPSRESRFGSAAEFVKALEQYTVASGLVASPLRFAEFLMFHFGETILATRRARARAARALRGGSAVETMPTSDVEPPTERAVEASAEADTNPMKPARTDLSEEPPSSTAAISAAKLRAALGPDADVDTSSMPLFAEDPPTDLAPPGALGASTSDSQVATLLRAAEPLAVGFGDLPDEPTSKTQQPGGPPGQPVDPSAESGSISLVSLSADEVAQLTLAVEQSQPRAPAVPGGHAPMHGDDPSTSASTLPFAPRTTGSSSEGTSSETAPSASSQGTRLPSPRPIPVPGPGPSPSSAPSPGAAVVQRPSPMALGDAVPVSPSGPPTSPDPLRAEAPAPASMRPPAPARPAVSSRTRIARDAAMSALVTSRPATLIAAGFVLGALIGLFALALH